MKKGWQSRKLGDLAELVTKGTTPTSTGHNFVPEGINFIKVESLSAGGEFIADKLAHITAQCHEALKRSQLKSGDILFSIAGALGRTAIVSGDVLPANTNQALAIIRLKDDPGVLDRFVFTALQTGFVLEQIEKFKGGVAQQNLSLAQVRNFEIPVPPLSEQQRILRVLDEAFAGVATAKDIAEKNLQNGRTLFESHLQYVFTNHGKRWVERPLEAVSTILNGFAFRSTDFSSKMGTKCVKITNVGIRTFVPDSDTYLPNHFSKDYAAVSLMAGSIVIALTRSIIAAGLKVAIVPIEYEGALLNQRVAAIKTDERVLGCKFLFAYLSTQRVSHYVTEHVNTLMQPNLSIVDLRAMPVPIPPLAEQLRITAQLDAFAAETQRLTQLYKQKLAALVALKKSLLHQAFNGEL